jgi:hypothetical protein
MDLNLTFFAEMDRSVFTIIPTIVVARETDDFCGDINETTVLVTWGPFAVGVAVDR